MRTVVTREPEWDDFEREKMLKLAEYEASLCTCGLPEHIADEDPDLDMVERVCPVCVGIAKSYRIIHAADAEVVRGLGKSPDPKATRPEDGRRFTFRPKRQSEAPDAG